MNKKDQKMRGDNEDMIRCRKDSRTLDNRE